MPIISLCLVATEVADSDGKNSPGSSLRPNDLAEADQNPVVK
jgi:hypothetical protein